MHRSKLLITGLLFVFLTSCSAFGLGPDKDETVTVSFYLKSQLLWNISHNYKVSGTDGKGKKFTSDEIEIAYSNYLFQDKKIKKGSTVTLFIDGHELWTSKKIEDDFLIIYTNSAFQDEVEYK